ncbi:peroxidase family protein [Sabulicella rubraurantiaca]|uniref:peroxidase family protein n=1 Tax=Sabulicella rubraurantiaca TaxID=2811429 RepID=UPI001A977076|nr:peroxidase family protein [Sabulicella rubraurantiaca]
MIRLLGVLNKRLENFDEVPEDVSEFENPNIPSGYTYVLQLIAHDCVRTSTPFWAVPDALPISRNTRLARLQLDTLYGEGPSACPHAYAPDDAEDTSRTRLGIGRMRAAPDRPADGGFFRDIPRAGVIRAGNGPAKPNPADPLIADPRNEDNALVAQVTTLFCMLHNVIVDMLSGLNGRDARAIEKRFVCARAATTMIYRHILCHDVLRRILDCDVREAYEAKVLAADDPSMLLHREDGQEDGFVSVPLEFSHGAFRFAHSMVRPLYRTNGSTRVPVTSALMATSARRPAAMPLGEAWILRWSNFFELPEVEGSKPNFSLRVGPRYTKGMFNTTLFPSPFTEDDTGAGERRHGVAFLDLLSAERAGLWSVNALYEEARIRMTKRGWPDVFAKSGMATPEARRDAVKKFLLRERPLSDVPCEEDIKALSEDPPLPFYVQLEAELDGKGERLGPLGSILVGEVIYDALMEHRLPGEDHGQPLGEKLGALLRQFRQPPEVLSDAARVCDMAALVSFVHRNRVPEEGEPKFL